LAVHFFPARRPVLVVATLAALAVSACGRRGDLEPPNASATQTPANNHALALHRVEKITPQHQSFALDPLLQ
jgi:predicted small lipoprotein YifL